MRVRVILDDDARNGADTHAILERLVADGHILDPDRVRFERHGTVTCDVAEVDMAAVSAIPGVRSVERGGRGIR